ncbi:hypothetical protein CPB85DRAFT_1458351 [Mucidula mucida]|nr:hypothetical protein CPB85DRAFT_1458351 [Mucidula mucida]
MNHSHGASLSGVQRWFKPLSSIRNRLMRFYKQPSRPIINYRLEEGLSTLPVELLELIFQLAASDSYETALRLLRVSSAVKKWTAPILYHTVHLRTARHAQLFQRTTDHLIPSNPSFLATNVRYIVFEYRFDDIQDVFCILRACTGIIGLAHETAVEPWPGNPILRLAELTEPSTRLTRLFLGMPEMFRTRLTLPCTLTHLSLNIDPSGFLCATIFRL